MDDLHADVKKLHPEPGDLFVVRMPTLSEEDCKRGRESLILLAEAYPECKFVMMPSDCSMERDNGQAEALVRRENAELRAKLAQHEEVARRVIEAGGLPMPVYGESPIKALWREYFESLSPVRLEKFPRCPACGALEGAIHADGCRFLAAAIKATDPDDDEEDDDTHTPDIGTVDKSAVIMQRSGDMANCGGFSMIGDTFTLHDCSCAACQNSHDVPHAEGCPWHREASNGR